MKKASKERTIEDEKEMDGKRKGKEEGNAREKRIGNGGTEEKV